MDSDTVVRNLMEPVFAVDRDGDVAFANQRFLAISGFSRDELLGADYGVVAEFVAAGFSRLERFASVVSHDLRNPLTVADGHLRFAREERDSDHLEGVARAHDRMDALVRDLLALTREGGFFVEDDGVGIPERDRARVFDSGYSTGADGTGFGLHIVRTIADAHGWDVTATDGSDGGARFEFRDVETA